MLVALIGLGGIAHRVYLPLLSTWEGIDLLVSSRREESVRQVQERYHIRRGATNLDEVIQQRPRAALVLTPAETHAEIAQRLLKSGIDVYLEKPATLHSTETRELAELADLNQRIVMVGFNRRFAPIHRQARDLLGSSPVSLAQFSKYRRGPTHPDLFHQMIDDTIHQIDTLRYFCGEAQALSTHWIRREDKISAAIFTVQLEQGGLAQVTTSLEAGMWKEEYDIYAGNQSVRIEAFDSLHLATQSGDRSWHQGYASKYVTTLEGRGFTGEVRHFIECVEKREQPQTSAWDSVKTQELLEGMLQRSNSA